MVNRGVATACITALIVGNVFSGCQPPGESLEDKVKRLESENRSLQHQIDSCQAEQTRMVQREEQKKTELALVNDIDNLPKEAQDLIREKNKANIFGALASGAFKPYETITRGEFTQWFFSNYNYNHRSSPIIVEPNWSPIFKDVPPTHPAFGAIQGFARAGFNLGYTDNTYRPDKVMSREELAQMLYKLYSEKSYSKLSKENRARTCKDFQTRYDDAKSIDPNYCDAMTNQGGLWTVFGKSNYLRPKEPVKRYEAALALRRSG